MTISCLSVNKCLMDKKNNSTNYFSHDSNARNSDKLIRLRMRYKAAGYGVYFMILERLREEPNYMSVKDYNMIAFDLREDASLIKSVVEDFGLFVFTEDGKYFYSESFNRRMAVKDEKARKQAEAGRKGMASKWGGTGNGGSTNSQLRSQRLKAAREKGTHTSEEWDEMKGFFGECVICGSKENIVKDHIVPLYQGGSDAISNLQPLCSSCNSRKGADSKDYRIVWCASHGVEMPNKWLTEEEKCLTSKEKESKEKESKEINKEKNKETKKEKNTREEDDKTIDEKCLCTFRFFNEMVQHYKSSIKPVKVMTDERKRKLEAVVLRFTSKQIAQAIGNAMTSDYLNGRTPRRKLPADFDWIFEPKNFARIFEGSV